MDDDRSAIFVYRGWEVRLQLACSGANFAGHAELWLNGDHKRRVVLVNSRDSDAAARQALKLKAQRTIDEWIANPHTGTTTFGELDAD